MLGNKQEKPAVSGEAKTKIRITVEEAREQVIEWLKARKFRDTKIDLFDDLISDFAESMIAGELVLGDDGLFTYHLLFPLKNKDQEIYISEVKLKDRIDYERGVKPHMSKIKNADSLGQLQAYSCGLSGLHMNELRKLDTRDSGFLRNYASLFF